MFLEIVLFNLEAVIDSCLELLVFARFRASDQHLLVLLQLPPVAVERVGQVLTSDR